MLRLVEDSAKKAVAQEALMRTLTAALENQGTRGIGFPGGSAEAAVYSNGDGQLWCAFEKLTNATIPRNWNPFGVFDSSRTKQIITVEINIPVHGSSGRIAGFFAEDPLTGRTYLMHDGSIGGGKPGVGRTSFVAWSKEAIVEVLRENRSPREGIIVGQVDAPDLPSRIWRFVQLVNDFKKAVAQGVMDSEAMRDSLSEWEAFTSESSGRRTGSRRSEIDYLSYHGEVVQRLYQERSARQTEQERVLNSPLIDLYVRTGGTITEVYEVKTSLHRQALYAAIGQILTHSICADSGAKRILVLPEGALPDDIQQCLSTLSITVRRFKVTGSTSPQAVLC